MELKGKKIGFALTGSFCTLSRVINEIKKMCDEGAEIVPIISNIVDTTDTRFGKSEDLKNTIMEITNNKIIRTIKEAEPIGPKNFLDALVIAPCTGNTLGKLALGITDTPVTMAAKATLRNKKPVIVAVSTNDGLGASAKNIGVLLNSRNYYFVPIEQDDPVNKATSLVAKMENIIETVEYALDGKQIQPVIMGSK